MELQSYLQVGEDNGDFATVGASGRSRGRFLATLEGRLPGLVQVRAFREACPGSHDGPFAKNYICTILGFTCIQVEATLRAYSKRGSPKSRMGVAEPPPAPDRERPGRRGTRTRASCTKISSSGR